MEPSVPGPCPWTPAAQACVSDAPTMTQRGSALCGPLCCSNTELGTTPPHHQQPGTRSKFPTGALIWGGHYAHVTLSLTPGVICVIIRGRMPRGLEGPRLQVREEVRLAPGCHGSLSGTLRFSHLTNRRVQCDGCQLTLPRTATTLTWALAPLPPPAFTLPSCSHPLQSPAREPFLKTPPQLASYVDLTAVIRMVTQC